MKWVVGIVSGVVVIAAAGIGLMFATGSGAVLMLGYAMVFGAPDKPFDPTDAVAAPDYEQRTSWAALPDGEDLADYLPAGVSPQVRQGQAPVDVFFIHPTGFLKGSSWTYSMNVNTSSEENTGWMMANQASAYNGCCNVYAPRYRQASIYAYFQDDELRDAVLSFSYQDVARAFEYFIEEFSQGRPFVIASHSQGTHHGVRLVREQIDGTPLAARMVAAYLIGGGVAKSKFDDLANVTLCDGPTQLGCVIHWDTYSEAKLDQGVAGSEENICTNPLTWRLGGGLAGRQNHRGGVTASGAFNIELMGEDTARNVEFEPLTAPVTNHLQAQCKDGILYVSDQSESPFGALAGFGDGSYHGLDYPLFHMDIRENVQARVSAYLATPVDDEIPRSGR